MSKVAPNGNSPSPPPTSMDDLLNRAHNAWQFKRKDEAITLLIAGMRLMSQGVAKALKDLDHLNKLGQNKQHGEHENAGEANEP